MARPFNASWPCSDRPRVAGFENLTKGLVSSADHRFTVNEPPSLINRCVTAALSTATAIRTGSIDTCVTQLVVIAFHSSRQRDPTRTSALGIFHVTALTRPGSMTWTLRLG